MIKLPRVENFILIKYARDSLDNKPGWEDVSAEQETSYLRIQPVLFDLMLQGLIVVAFHGDELYRYYEDHLLCTGKQNFWHNMTHLEKSLCRNRPDHQFLLMSQVR